MKCFIYFTFSRCERHLRQYITHILKFQVRCFCHELREIFFAKQMLVGWQRAHVFWKLPFLWKATFSRLNILHNFYHRWQHRNWRVSFAILWWSIRKLSTHGSFWSFSFWNHRTRRTSINCHHQNQSGIVNINQVHGPSVTDSVKLFWIKCVNDDWKLR